jgi:starch synthase
VISRVVEQKGIDILADVMDDIQKSGAQFILLGTGDEKYHLVFEEIGRKYPGKASINLKFDAVLAQKIYAGCDIFLMPSKYEPCGLGQIISLKYGTIPVVRRTGGLADTVVDYDVDRQSGCGFVFEEYSRTAFWDAIDRTLSVYAREAEWENLVKRAMQCDFSWDRSAEEYVRIYGNLLNGR